MKDTDIESLGDLLISNPNIWALNVGETSNISEACWKRFCEKLRQTNVTHLYTDGVLKSEMEAIIYQNKNKHTNHINQENFHIIKQITHMWG
jgi:hypothetical protein